MIIKILAVIGGATALGALLLAWLASTIKPGDFP